MTQNKLSDLVDSHSFREGAGLDPDGPLYSQQWGFTAIHASQVWSTFTGDRSIIIAFLDSGLDGHDPDMEENIRTIF
ncbi:MAG: hypothetical protein ABSG89_12480 [Bacteroidales bacterium]|jgi:hypothetical protein